ISLLQEFSHSKTYALLVGGKEKERRSSPNFAFLFRFETTSRQEKTGLPANSESLRCKNSSSLSGLTKFSGFHLCFFPSSPFTILTFGREQHFSFFSFPF